MSFQKRSRQPLVSGTKPSIHNSQLVTSTGNPSLDHLLGGGQQISTVYLVEEDEKASYSNVLTRYYVSEGLHSQHRLFFASLEDGAKEKIIEKLPAPVEVALGKQPDDPTQEEDLRIAWRYKDLPQVDSTAGSGASFERNFDLSTTVSEEDLKKADISYWNDQIEAEGSHIKNTYLNRCIEAVHKEIQRHESESPHRLLRVIIHSLGAPYWYKPDFYRDLVKFLQLLRGLIRHSTAVALVTVPVHVLEYVDAKFTNKIRSLVDYAVQLESFEGSEKATNPIFKDYKGLLYVRRIRAVNCPIAYLPKDRDLAFRVKRKKFIIEKLHLPPELQDSQEREQDDVKLSCSGTTGSNKLDF